MSSRIEPDRPIIAVEATRTRQTDRPVTPFREVLASSVGILLSGAEVATSVVAGPVLGAAVREMRLNATAEIAGNPANASPSAQHTSVHEESADIAAMHSMQRESQAFNMQLLGLQEEVQQENRRFTTLSNVMRAKHDTAKAALSNIRS